MTMDDLPVEFKFYFGALQSKKIALKKNCGFLNSREIRAQAGFDPSSMARA